ncbi:hypothetical protein [Streptomyces antibioticus]|uniref:hypothetical protein n=1 Tax=Streptomyces antibioticus TaxID=1890 RepID=UPI00340AC38B
MTAIPAAAVAVIAAALDDYRHTTPDHQQTPHGAAERAAEFLLSSGWDIRVPRDPRPRAACPACTVRHLLTQAGRIRRHGPHAHPCPGSGAYAAPTPAPGTPRPERTTT